MPPLPHANSNLLSAEEYQSVASALGKSRVSVSLSVCQLFLASPRSDQWTLSHTGAVSFSKDNGKRTYFLQVVDLSEAKVIWEQELFSQFSYKRPKPYFHMFQGDSCTVGLNFADEGEALLFGQEVDKKVSQRQERKMAKQSSNAPPRPANTKSMSRQSSGGNLNPTPAPSKSLVGRSSIMRKKDDKKAKKGKDGKAKIRKLDISAPSNFQHLSHIGWDPVSGFDSSNVAPEWQRLLSAAGVTEAQMQDQETAEFIMNYIEEHGGIQQAILEMDAGGNPFGGGKNSAPPPPGRGGAPPPPPPSSRQAPPSRPGSAPPPPSRGGPPPPPPALHAPHGGPPPPPGRAPPPLSPRSGGPAPPPPPPLGGGGPPPPPPPPAGGGPPPPPAPSAGGRLPPPSPGGDGGGGGRGGLLDSIRQGAALKKVEAGSGVEKSEDDSGDGDGDGGGSMANALARALADRSKAIHSDGEADEFDDEDEDWD